jgi:dTDP-glucose pyrophosphorylase
MNKVNILIPMAGNGSRFADKGYKMPKPLISVFGRPMISWVINNFDKIQNKRFIFICRTEHEKKYKISEELRKLSPDCHLIFIDALTEGAACTTLLAKEKINNDDQLIIANSDQFVKWDESEFLAFCQDGLDAGILTFPSQAQKWSYAKLDEASFVNEVAEKKVISEEATVGIYYWKHGSDYVKFAEQMIEKNMRVNNEFYVCPVFNEAIADGKKIKTFQIERDAMWGLGTPEDLEHFLQNYKG